jgi:hypothetical protein
MESEGTSPLLSVITLFRSGPAGQKFTAKWPTWIGGFALHTEFEGASPKTICETIVRKPAVPENGATNPKGSADETT